VVYTSELPFVYLCADVAAFSMRPDDGLAVLLIRRGEAPYKGRWALPGGFVDEGEDVEKAARRELTEETGLRVGKRPLRHLGAYAAPRRDPRHRTVSMSYWAVVDPEAEATAGDDAADVRWWPVEEVLASKRLAFDHATILADATDALGRAMETTTIATSFLPEEFTVAELRLVYEAVWGRLLDAGNFQRKVLKVPGFLVDSGWRTAGGRGRPATLYTAGEGGEIWPPMSRSRDA
jgi:8-oxo-dGTP diphosphatase